MARFSVLVILSLAASGLARNVPDSVRALYNSIRAQGQCSNKLATGFWSTDRGTNTFSYCGDHLADSKLIYIQGTGGALTNMDIDCDGIQGGPGDDGRCTASRDTQNTTSFRQVLTSYRRGVTNLNANIHPYVVFGNEGSKPGWRTFDPRSVGVQPLSIIAVVCGDKLVYGIWGDTNGDDGQRPMVGEASISLATECYGNKIDGNTGHDPDDVLYLAFTGSDAVPGADGANWAATDFASFESSLQARGDALIQRIGASGGNSIGSPGDGAAAWLGHGILLPMISTLAVSIFLT